MPREDRTAYAKWYREEKKRCYALGIPMSVRAIRPKTSDVEEQKKRRRERNKKYKLAHPDKVVESNRKGAAERGKRYYEKHKMIILEKQKASEDGESRKKAVAKYLNNKKEARRIVRMTKPKKTEEEIEAKKEKRKEYLRKLFKKRSSTDAVFRVTRALRLSVWRIVKHKPLEKHRYRTFILLGVDRDGFLRHIESKFQEGMTWYNYGKWHIDHERPLASFDFSREDDIREACHYTNMQPLWARDNQRKSAKWPTDPA